MSLGGSNRGPGKLSRLINRADFLRLAKGRKFVTPGLVLQMQKAPEGIEDARLGITVTKRLGNAVVRNRAKRRLREAAKLTMPLLAQPGCDYVLIGRDATASMPFVALVDELKLALSKVHSRNPNKEQQA